MLIPGYASSMLSSRVHRQNDLQTIPGSHTSLACPCKCLLATSRKLELRWQLLLSASCMCQSAPDASLGSLLLAGGLR